MDGLDWSRYDDQEIDYDTGEWRAVSPTNRQRNKPKGSQIRTSGGAIGAGGGGRYPHGVIKSPPLQ